MDREKLKEYSDEIWHHLNYKKGGTEYYTWAFKHKNHPVNKLQFKMSGAEQEVGE